MKKYFYCFIFLIFAVVLFGAENKVRIIFSGSTLGRSLKFADNNGENQAGYSARKTLIDGLKKNDGNIILVDTGNFVSEYYLSSLTDCAADYTAMNMIGYDVAGIGFNEINRNLTSYNNLYKKSAFTMISCNVKNLKGKGIAEPYFIKTVNGIKVGFVSVLNENVYLALSNEAKSSVTVENQIVAMEKTLAQMKEKEKVDVIIALTNVDYHSDLKSGAGFLVSLFPSIDLVIEGAYGANKNKIFNVNGTKIYTIEKNGTYLGDITFELVKKGGGKNQLNVISEQFHPINACVSGKNISRLIPEDKKLLQRLEKITENVNSKLSSSVRANVITTEFSSVGKMDNFTQLCCIATDALRVGTGADVAFLNAGLFKEVDLSKKRKLEYTFASDLLKYDNNAVIVNLRGDELKKIVEYSMIRRGYGYFLIFSGMDVEYSAEDQKVTDLRIYQKKVVDDKIYKVAVSDFLANGGDTYYFFEREKNKVFTYIPISKLINDYVTRINNITNDTVDMKRLKIIE